MAHIADVIKYEGDNSTFVSKRPSKKIRVMLRVLTLIMFVG